MTTPVDQEFVAHLFLFEEGPLADEAYAALRRTWAACRQQLGTTAPITGLPHHEQLPLRRQDLPAGDVLAGQERSGTRDRQCVLRRVGRVLNLSVMMEQRRPERSGPLRTRDRDSAQRLGWREFSELWSRVSGHATESQLGETVLLLALTKRKRSPEPTPQLAESLTHLLPHNEKRRSDWVRRGTTSPQGFAVWETADDQQARTRELVLAAPWNSGRQLSSWVWSDDGSANLPPFAEYLLHGALLRYHAEVVEHWQATPRQRDVADLVRDLLGADEAPSEDQTSALRSHLRRLQRNELDLDALIERLRWIVDVGNDSLEQMGRAWGGSGNPASIITADLEVATSLVKQAERERDIHTSRQARTRNARQLVADELSRSPRDTDHRSRGNGASSPVSPPADITRNVFVVHGRDGEARREITSILQALNLRPMDWELLVSATGTTTPTIMEVIRTAPAIAQATVVLMTPDDVVQLHPDLTRHDDSQQETDLGCQPRPNVILELGMALMAAPESTIILEFGALRPMSDLAGLHVIRFDGSARSIAKLIHRLRQAGCPVDVSDTHLFDSGRFTEFRAFTRRPHTVVDGV